MDQIEMFAENGRVVIRFLPTVSKWTKARRIKPESALEFSALMMRSGYLPNTMTAYGDPEMVLQVAGADTDREGVDPKERYAWLGIQAWGYKGDRGISAYIGGDLVTEIGRCLHQLYMEVSHPEMIDGECSIFTRKVWGFFLSGENGEEDIHDLNSIHPEHL
jgi:hypothetical protein